MYSSAYLLANYTFDESGGTTAIDRSTNANHGTLVNNPLRSFGTYDVQSKCLKLDGTLNQSVTIAGTPYSSVDLNTMTLSAWVNTVDNAAHKSIVSKGSTEFDFAINADGKMEFIAGAVTCTSASVIPSNAWNHLAVTLDEYKGEVKFYKNGTVTDTFTPNPFVNIPMTTTDLTIGNNFTGELDNVMIHQGVVDFATETQLYTIPDSMYTPQTITSESWTHVAAVYDKEKNMVSMFQNGQHTGSFENYMTDFTDVGVNNKKKY